MRLHIQHNETGQAGSEILFFAFVILLSMTLVVANAWAVIDAKFMVTVAAREGARSFVKAANADEGLAGALSSVDASIEREGGRLGRRIPTDVVGQFGRCERVVVTVGYKIPSVQVPVLGYTFGTRKVSATHSEVVDPYRSGLDGEVGGECV